MTLKEHIEDICDSLQKGLFIHEAAVSDSIVRRLLDALDWPIYNPQLVFPQYPVEGGKVDFALCHPVLEPCVFIEVKHVGNIEGAEEQLFRYAFRRGVPIAILTDGQKWRFFYPIGQGSYRERLVHEIDFTEDDSENSAERLSIYLNYKSIRTGEAIKAIEEDYRYASRQRQVATRLPEAWNKLVEEADEFLVDVVAEKVESLCGYRPTNEQVLNFLKNLENKTKSNTIIPSSTLTQQTHRKSISPTRQTTQGYSREQKVKASPRGFTVIMPNDERIESTTSQNTFVEALLKLIEMLGEERVISADKNRSCISTAPLREGVRPRSYGKYFISTNHGTSAKKRLLDRIASNLGVRLKVEIYDK